MKKDKKEIDTLANVIGALFIGMVAILVCLIWSVIVTVLIGESPFLSMLSGFLIGIAAVRVYEKLKDK